MSKNHFLHYVLMLLTLTNIGYAANILAMFPMPFFSHTNNFLPIFKELALRGHNVTVVSPFPQKSPVPNLTDVVVPNFFDKFIANVPLQQMLDNNGFWFQLIGLSIFGLNGIKIGLECEQVQRFIKDTDSKYELVIAETWFIQEPFVAFGHKYNAPVINIMPAFLFPMAAHLSGNHLPIAYSPLNRLGFNDHMTFLERIQNFFFYYWDVTFGELYYFKKQDEIMREYFNYPGSENLPPLADMLRNTSLTLIDYNFGVGYPVPLHMNIVPFGGINVHRPEKLTEDLQSFMDNAKDGVIYLNFGSFLTISVLKPEVQDAIIAALGKAKQKVLIKLEDPSILKNYPYKNIEGRRWFPQSSILAHPNCKLFITHGGLHGLMEGVYNAVPFVAVPLAADQKFNGKFIETAGIGITLDRMDLTEEKLSNAMETVINNPKYRENVKERSSIFKDKPVDTLDNAIYWIEYVIRHKGAPHLRPAVLDLHWYQYLMLDVLAFYLLAIFIIIYIIKYVIKKLFRCIKCLIFRKNKATKKSKKE